MIFSFVFYVNIKKTLIPRRGLNCQFSEVNGTVPLVSYNKIHNLHFYKQRYLERTGAQKLHGGCLGLHFLQLPHIRESFLINISKSLFFAVCCFSLRYVDKDSRSCSKK